MSHAHDPVPILVITNERDFAADTVIKRLVGWGIQVDRWNTAPHRDVSWRPADPALTAGYGAVWLRQFLAEPSAADSVAEVEDFLVTREQWRAWLADLAEDTRARWMNPLWAARRAENKLAQLRTATAIGLDLPPTVVTNSPREAAEHQSSVGPCVVKSVASAYFPFSDSAFMFTRRLDDALAHDESEWVSQPVVVQRLIWPRLDIRLFVVGTYVAAVSTRVDSTDWRTRSGEAVWTRFDAPVAIIDRCRAYLETFGLAYGAFDFAFDGVTWWFLECNQAGEFAFVDRPLELGVADAIGRWLAGETP